MSAQDRGERNDGDRDHRSAVYKTHFVHYDRAGSGSRHGAMSTARLRSRRAAAGFWVLISGSTAFADAGTARGAGAGADALRAVGCVGAGRVVGVGRRLIECPWNDLVPGFALAPRNTRFRRDNSCWPGPASPGRRRTVAGIRSRAWPSSLSKLPWRNDRICHTRRRSSSLFAPRSRGIR